MTENRFKNQCLKIFERVEKQRNEIFSKLDALTEKQLHHNPGPGEWNILQVILHLKTAEKLSVNYIKRKARSDEAIPKSGILSKLRSATLKFALKLPIKFTSPKITDTTDKDPDYEELKSEWEEIRSDLKSLIKKLDEDTLKKEIFNHVVAGKMNMKQALEFIEMHTAHHRKQIQRIMSDPSFPERE